MLKPWWQSRTIIGAVISMAAIGLRNIGVELSDEQQAQIVTLTFDLIGLIGGVMAVQGRVKAKGVIK